MKKQAVEDGSLQTTRLHSTSDLAPFLDAWRPLAAGMPMRSPEWLLGWWENFATANDDLCILLIHQPEGVLVGLAPLYIEEAGGRATLRILGAAEACTHHSTWLAAPGWETRVGEEVGRFLLQYSSDWNRLYFSAVDADALAIEATISFLVENGCLLHRRQVNSCWKIVLPSTWDEYLRMLSRTLRKRCRSLKRKYFDSGTVRVCQVESEADLEKGFEILLKLHSARWGTAETPLGVFEDKRFREFHKALSKVLLPQGKLRLAWLECDGKPIAAEYQFVDSRSVYAYQAGVDLTMDSYSPGKLSMMAAIRFAIEQGFEFFDLLGGDEPYKASWRASPLACYDLRLWKNGIAGRLMWAMWSLYTVAAVRLKRILPARIIDHLLKSFHRLKRVFQSGR